MNQHGRNKCCAYCFHIALLREDDGTFSAIAVNLPGTGSCGSTKKAALENVREAAVGIIASYREDDENIPWLCLGDYSIPDGATEQWITVDGPC